MTHPADLWKPTTALEIVRPKGMERMHQRLAGAAVALCGFEAAKWAVYPALPATAPFCEACWVAAGKIKVREQGLSRTALQADAAWPFPNHHLKDMK